MWPGGCLTDPPHYAGVTAAKRSHGGHYSPQVPSNRFLAAAQNLIMGYKLSEYHLGYRGDTRELLEALPLEVNSDGFVFDNQVLSQIIYGGYDIGEISCHTLYADDSSSIDLFNSLVSGLGILYTSVRLRLHRWGIIDSPLFAGVKSR
jgi:hypothetical protein